MKVSRSRGKIHVPYRIFSDVKGENASLFLFCAYPGLIQCICFYFNFYCSFADFISIHEKQKFETDFVKFLAQHFLVEVIGRNLKANTRCLIS